MKETFKIKRSYAGMKGYVAVQGGIYSESNRHTWDSEILVDGQWYKIPDHIDVYAFKHLIQAVDIEYIDCYGSNRQEKLDWGGYRGLPVKVLWDKNKAWDYTPKDGDVFDGYGIELDESKLISNPENLINYTIVWSKGLNIQKT
jgi:hypothetical protein